MGDTSTTVIRVVHDIGELAADQWDACANPAHEPFNPFLSHSFLHALESSGSAQPQTGWAPYHLALEDQGSLQAVMPMYLKSHSSGEYVFDHSWADALERVGGRYYPKLQVSIPFTPATGRRLLVRDAALEEINRRQLVAGAVEVTRQLDVSSVHITFMKEDEWRAAGDMGLLQRTDKQFHWRNEGYRTFDDFLGQLTSKKRKNLKRERREASAAGIHIERLTGDQITEAHWDAFYEFYVDTSSRKWGQPYLQRAFFSHIGDSMAQHILLILCRRDGHYMAGAINFIGADTLYGRNWGSLEYHPFLHFEVCYYQAIEFAIERGLKTVEAGAQGSHKVARGYQPALTHSAHYIADERLRQAVANFLREERNYVDEEVQYIDSRTPFRNES